MSEELVKQETEVMTAPQIRAQVNRVQEVMRAVMKENTHYGLVPGCGSKPTLLKPGAEKLMMTFRLAAEPQVQQLSLIDGVGYRVITRITSIMSGEFLGSGVGECSSLEEKYNWRKAVCDEEYNDTPEDRRRQKWFKGKDAPFQVKQLRTNYADIANTVLKMAKKRSLVDAILTVTGASDIFTQDIEDMPTSLLGDKGEGKSTITPPQQKTQTTGTPSESGGDITGFITDVKKKEGINANKKPYTRFSVTIGSHEYSTFNDKIGELAKKAFDTEKQVNMTYVVEGKYRNIETLGIVEEREPGQDD